MKGTLILITCLALGLIACNGNQPKTESNDADTAALSANLTADDAKRIAKETYIAMFPLVFNYGTMYAQAINPAAKEYIGGFGVYRHYGLASPANKDIPTPNNNTPYSWAWVDLRTEPWVLTMPPSDGNRYYTCQWDDMWAYVIDAPGSVFDGQGGGNYLLCTSGYKGELPKGIKRAIIGESEFLGTLTRTGVNGDADVPKMKAIQQGYKLQPLSKFLGTKTPTAAPAINWPLYNPADLKTINFFAYANFMLSYTIPNPADKPMLENAAKIGVAAGKPWEPQKMGAEIVKAIEEGIIEGDAAIQVAVANTKDGTKLFNTRAKIETDYLNRSAGVVIGQFGNYPVQAMYPAYQVDGENKPLDASKNNYTVTFPSGQIPKSQYFWSFTMYDLPGRFLVDNPINRYSIGSQTTAMKKEKDGSLIVYFQKTSPGKEKEGNWLPTPDGPFFCVLRIYGPSEDVINGTYQVPPMIASKKN